MSTVYQITVEELIQRFERACLRAGCSGSGLVISAGSGFDAIEVQYARGAILARFADQDPPFQPNQRLRLKEGVKKTGGWRSREIKAEETHVVRRVFYERTQWTIAFKGHDDFDHDGRRCDRYRAEQFELAPAEAIQASTV